MVAEAGEILVSFDYGSNMIYGQMRSTFSSRQTLKQCQQSLMVFSQDDLDFSGFVWISHEYLHVKKTEQIKTILRSLNLCGHGQDLDVWMVITEEKYEAFAETDVIKFW